MLHKTFEGARDLQEEASGIVYLARRKPASPDNYMDIIDVNLGKGRVTSYPR